LFLPAPRKGDGYDADASGGIRLHLHWLERLRAAPEMVIAGEAAHGCAADGEGQ
jgi:hypothetical protein